MYKIDKMSLRTIVYKHIQYNYRGVAKFRDFYFYQLLFF